MPNYGDGGNWSTHAMKYAQPGAYGGSTDSTLFDAISDATSRMTAAGGNRMPASAVGANRTTDSPAPLTIKVGAYTVTIPRAQPGDSKSVYRKRIYSLLRIRGVPSAVQIKVVERALKAQSHIFAAKSSSSRSIPRIPTIQADPAIATGSEVPNIPIQETDAQPAASEETFVDSGQASSPESQAEESQPGPGVMVTHEELIAQGPNPDEPTIFGINRTYAIAGGVGVALLAAGGAVWYFMRK